MDLYIAHHRKQPLISVTSMLIFVSLANTARHQLTLRDHGCVSRDVPVCSSAFDGILIAPTLGGMAWLTCVAGSAPRWFTRHETVTHPCTNRDRRRVTTFKRVDSDKRVTTKPNRHACTISLCNTINTTVKGMGYYIQHKKLKNDTC